MAEPKFYVHIIESPAPNDLLDGRTEGLSLCSLLELAQIPFQYNLAVDRERFDTALKSRMIEAFRRFKLPPILHIGCHGNATGIQLTDQQSAGKIIPWHELGELLAPLKAQLGGIGVCMSSCGGSHGKKMAEVMQTDAVPMAWIVGTSGTVNYCDAALAFAVFYRCLQRGASQEQLLTAMRAASGVDDFAIYMGHLVQEDYSRKQMTKIMEDLLLSLEKS